MLTTEKKIPEQESIRKAMELAWKDHHHARDQTWKTLHLVAILGAGLITIDIQYNNFFTTLFSAFPLIFGAIFGMLVTWHHRKLERRKFIHIMNCEELLGLHRYNLIPLDPEEINKFMDQQDINKLDDFKQKYIKLQTGDKNDREVYQKVKDSSVKVPKPFKMSDIFNFKEKSTALFILRIHMLLLIFAIIIVFYRGIASFY